MGEVAHAGRRVDVLAEAGTDLPAFPAHVQLQDQQLVGVGMGRAFDDRRYAQVKLGKIVVLYGCRPGRSGR